MVTVKLIFVRHGKDDDKYRGGWSDLDLIPEGVEQAKRLAKHLGENSSDYRITYILSSDLQRAVTTAQLISAELGIPIQQESRIREINNGDLAGMPNDAAEAEYPNLYFSSLAMNESYPNGESPRDFCKRITAWFSEFSTHCRDMNGNALIVTHGGVINVVYHLIKGMEWSNKNPSFKAGHCSIHIINMDTMEIETENKTDFLPA